MTRQTNEPGAATRQQRTSDRNAWSAEEGMRTRIDAPPPAMPLGWGEFAVQSVEDNYLVCKRTDGIVTWGDDINVAKDPELRASAYDGKTIDGLEYAYTSAQERTVTKEGTSDSKDQMIIPKYHVPADGPEGFVGSIITAAPIPTRVVIDEETTLWCNWREITQRAFANVEAAE